MIETALTTILKEIGGFLKLRYPTTQDIAILSPVVLPNGSSVAGDSLLVSLVSIEEERAVKAQSAAVLAPDKKTTMYVNPEIKLNLYVLVSSNYQAASTYITGIKYLSDVIRFFQGKNVFDMNNTPTLDPAIQKLVVELQTQNFEQMNHLWAGLGAKYLPSVLYKVRMLVVQEGRKQSEQALISKIKFSDRSI